MMNLNSVLKSKDIVLLTKVCIVKAMVFPVVICGCESWTVKKDEHRRHWRFQTVVMETTLESPWTAKRSNQSILKEISLGCSLEGLMLKVKLLFWPPVAKSWLIWKDPDAGKDWGQEEKGITEDEMVGWHHWLNGHEFGWTLELVIDRESWHAGSWGRKESDTTEWTELNSFLKSWNEYDFWGQMWVQ